MSHLNFDGYPYPVIPVSGNVVTQGQFGDLKQAAGSVSVGIYDAQTYGIATGSGNGKEYFLGYSSEHSVDDLTYHLAGMKDPKKNQVFAGKDVISFEFSNPQKPQNEVWRIGYNGAPNSVGLKFKSGTTYGIMIDLEGNPIFRVFGKSLRHEIWITTDPVAGSDCEVGCDEGVDCEKYTKMFADKINEHVELSKLGIKARAVLSTYSAPSDTITRYRITLNDGCGDLGLAVVQASVGAGKEVKVISKDGCATTYEVCSATLPSAITPARQYSITQCDACPSGYTLTEALDVWYVRRPLAGTEDFTSDAAKDTYADTVGTAYSVATDALKTFEGQDGSVAIVKIKVPVGTAVTALAADTVEKVASEAAYCTSDTVPSAVNWSSAGTAYRVQRQLKMTLPRTNCNGVFSGSNRLTEVTAFVAQFPSYVSESISVSADNDNCVDEYTISQWSEGCMEAGCLEVDQPTFSQISGIDGNAWEVVPTADSPEAGKLCGLEVYGGYVDTKFGDCSFDPYEYYEMEPIRLNLSMVTRYPFPDAIDYKTMPKAIKMQEGRIGRQSGEWLLREYLNSAAYEKFGQWYKEPRLREALNSRRQQQVERSAYYKVYYLRHKAQRIGTDQKQEMFEPIIAFKENDIAKQQAFENAMLAALAKHGVTLQQRDI